MYYELNKREKKIARALIEKGVNAEFKKALKQSASILAEWQNGDLDNRSAYHKLFKWIDEQNEKIARRYDAITGSKYLITVAEIYADGQITADDLQEFSEGTKEVLNSWLFPNGGESL